MVSMQMEENSPSPQLSPTPQCVGREFVRQYYTLLAEAPRYVHRFYSNESIFVHGTDTEEIIGQTAIQNKIRDLSFEECRTRIRALDAHETLGKGVVVQVVGEISVNGSPMRRFVQTFVLAPQSEKKYYVHNDIFRYEDELFEMKMTQENGAPADPDAEKTNEDRRRLHSVTPDEQPTINNGSTHPEEIQNVRPYMQQIPAQQPPPMSVLTQQIPPPIASSGYVGVSTALPPPMVGPVQPQIGDAISYPGVQGIEFNSGQSVAPTASAPSNVQQPVAPAVNQYGQPPLPQRSQPQQQLGQAPSGPMSASVAQPPSSQPPSEPASAATSMTVMEQPPRPASPDKTSPALSEDHEEHAETGTVDNKISSWSNVVKQKPPHRSPHQSSAAQQQPQHVAQTLPGPSAPAMLSPTGAVVPPVAGQHPQQDYNKPSTAPQQPPAVNRQNNQYRSQRPPPPNVYNAGGVSQDARSSPAPSGYQPTFAGPAGNRAGSTSSNVDTLPCEQQIYVRSLPLDTNDNEVKEIFESMGYPVVDVKLRRKPATQHQQQQCFAFVALESQEMAQKLVQRKNLTIRGGHDIIIDAKRNNDNRGPSGGGGGGNYQYNGPRPFQGSGGMSSGGGGSMGRGGMGPSRGGGGGMGQQRGGGASNRPMGQGGPGGFVQGGGGGGNRQQGGRTFNRGGGGNVAQHPPQ